MSSHASSALTLADFRREIYRRNERRIQASLEPSSSDFLTYQRRYSQSIQHYQCRVQKKKFFEQIARTPLVFLGDYHTLVYAQKAYLEILKLLSQHHKKITLAMECFTSTEEQKVQNYLEHKISFTKLCESTRLNTFYPAHALKCIEKILIFARSHQFSILALDKEISPKKSHALEKRDTHAAKKIACSLAREPNTPILVLFGELHLAPPHLPLALCKELERQGLKKPKTLIIHQNAEPIYDLIQKKKLEHHTDVVRIEANRYCLLNTPPIVCQYSFLSSLHTEEEEDDFTAHHQETFERTLHTLAKFFQIKAPKTLKKLTIETLNDLSFLEAVKHHTQISSSEYRWVCNKVMHAGSFYLPKLNLVYIGIQSINPISELASHVLLYSLSGELNVSSRAGFFYARIVRHALAFLGSKLINHRRKFKDKFNSSKKIHALEDIYHKFHRGSSARPITKLFNCPSKLFETLTQALGNTLGENLYQAFIDEIFTKEELRELFSSPI